MAYPWNAAPPLPVPLTPMIGRENDVAAVRGMLGRADVRLVNLVGPGGVGKTRLVLAVAQDAQADFADGQVIVSLGTVSDPDLVVPTLAQAMHVRENGEIPLVDQLVAVLRSQELLMVLDGMEGVVGSAGLLATLLAACPRIKILATSRLVLHLMSEHLHYVAPLGVPDLPDASPEDLGALDAVQLFVSRARAAAGFTLTAGNAVSVAAVCRQLDGLPLAIELAAARIRFLPPDALLARLERRLPLLTGGPQDAPLRHRTLTATIAWSYELLSDDERRWLRSLSVFAGGFTLDAADRVAMCDAAGVSQLVDHSLLHRIDHSGDDVRFAMLDTVREFARDRMDEGEEGGPVRRRHASWCLDMISAAEAALGTGSQLGWIRQIESMHENLRAAMQDARSSGDHLTLARLARGLWRYWYGKGLYTEGRMWVDAARATPGTLDPSMWLDLMIGAGTLAYAQGDESEAVALADEALVLARSQDDRRGLALILNLRGVVARDHGDYDRALSLLAESLELSRAIDNRWGIVLSINSLAILYQLRGDYERAASVLEESAALATAAGDTWGQAQAFSNMAHLSRRQGNFERAARLYERSGTLYGEIGDRRGAAVALTNLGRIAERQGDTDRAIALHQQSLEAVRTLGDRRNISTALANLGMAYLRKGDADQAATTIRESLQMRQAAGDLEGVATAIENLAEVDIARSRADRALRLWAAAAALRDRIGAPLAPSERESYDIVITAARAAMPDNRIAGMWEEGRMLATEAAVEYALHDDLFPLPSSGAGAMTSHEALPASGLTPRELDVLRLLEAHTDREIADQLFIGPRTVATHVTNILNKLGVNSRTAAVAHAIRRGYI